MPKLNTFCTAIKNFEGANPENNNPGNCRCSPVGYLPKYGVVKCNPNDFAVFGAYQLGWEYLEELVHHRVLLHPTWTFYDFFNSYAPSGDKNDPNHYAEVVAGNCGVSPQTTLATFLQS